MKLTVHPLFSLKQVVYSVKKTWCLTYSISQHLFIQTELWDTCSDGWFLTVNPQKSWGNKLTATIVYKNIIWIMKWVSFRKALSGFCCILSFQSFSPHFLPYCPYVWNQTPASWQDQLYRFFVFLWIFFMFLFKYIIITLGMSWHPKATLIFLLLLTPLSGSEVPTSLLLEKRNIWLFLIAPERASWTGL